MPAAGQDRSVHWSHAGAMPPGAIGGQRLLRGGPLSGYCQPVDVRVPPGARIAPVSGGGFGQQYQDAVLVGLYVGGVYRFRVSDIPDFPEVEVYPTVELVDRLYPPPGKFLQFPVPVELTREELLMAAERRFVTRIIYLEDPRLALPVSTASLEGEPWMEVGPGEDPLVAADSLGRPIAILRMGGRVPTAADGSFAYGPEPGVIYDRPPVDVSPEQPQAATAAPEMPVMPLRP